MMFCHNCGTKLDEGSLFCPECGARQQDTGRPHIETTPSVPLQTNEDGYNSQSSQKPSAEDHSSKDKRIMIALILIVVLGVPAGFLFSRNLGTSKTIHSDTQTADSMNAADKKPDIDKGTENADKESNTKTGSKDDEDTGKKTTAKEDDEKIDDKKNDDKDNDNKSDDKDNGKKESTEKIYIHEYTVIQGMQTWTDAKSYCEAQGGHLATTVNQEEYDQIVAKANGTGCLVLWLGAQRTADTGNFEWVTDEEFSYNAWAAGEPNNDGGSENYLGMMKVNGVWSMYDMPGDVSPYYSSDKVGFVMEKDIEQ